MKVSRIPGLGPYGTYIDDVDLMTISDEEWMEIGQIHIKSLVTIIRNANCDTDRQSELILKFGQPRHGQKVSIARKYLRKYGKDYDWVIKQALADSDLIDEDDKLRIRAFGNIAKVTKTGYSVAAIAGGYDEHGLPLGMFSEGELDWHSNESGTLTSCPGAGLLGYKGMTASATSFLPTANYYESLSDSMRRELDDMIVRHRFTIGFMAPGVNAVHDKIVHANMCPADDTEIPFVIQSPGGIKSIHYAPYTSHSIVGMSQTESNKFFDRIKKELFTDKYIYDHWYKSDNDFCLFDNSVTLHRRLGSIEGRLAYRVAFDYTNLQDGPYQPYFQKKYQKQYNKEIREVTKLAEITNFKFPKRSWTEYLPF